MNYKLYIFGVTALALAACSADNDVAEQHYSVGEADNAIVLSAGIVEGTSDAATRAGAEDNHAKHGTLTDKTVLALRVSGKWGGTDVIKATSATVGAVTAPISPEEVGKHNNVTCNPVLYWDDYGTADPGNTAGRTAGLTIYGVAINGEKSISETSPLYAISNDISALNIEGNKWAGLSWTLAANQSSGINAGDLLISNNVKSGTDDGTYTFGQSNKLLEFTHAMSKVTVVMTAGEGFAGGKFVGEPTADLLNFNTTGTVNVTTGTVTPTGSATPSINTYCTNETKTGQATITRTALVYPGRTLTASDVIATISADNNNYSVTAAKIVEAINTKEGTTTAVLKSGKNYILNITVNKTGINISATVANWIDVDAETDAPEIHIDGIWGTAGTTFSGPYSALISDVKNSGYNSVPLYWPNHTTPYYFRGVYPESSPALTTYPGSETAYSGYQVIAVSNGAWSNTTFPSQLAIGMPRKKNDSNVLIEDGPCTATKGTVWLNFQYAMSRVTVKVKSSDGGDKVLFGSDTKVEILNAYSDGYICIGTEDSIGKTKNGYEMQQPSYDNGTNVATFDDVILPQKLDGLQFRVTVKNADNSHDYYTTKEIKNISVKVGDSTDYTSIDGWASGFHYVYELDVRKTGITVNATITDWITASTSEDVWL